MSISIFQSNVIIFAYYKGYLITLLILVVAHLPYTRIVKQVLQLSLKERRQWLLPSSFKVFLSILHRTKHIGINLATILSRDSRVFFECSLKNCNVCFVFMRLNGLLIVVVLYGYELCGRWLYDYESLCLLIIIMFVGELKVEGTTEFIRFWCIEFRHMSSYLELNSEFVQFVNLRMIIF